MDELKSMRTFAQVVDRGSFAGAARAMDLAPSVVTRAVAELERHLGARLMTRTTRRIALTDVGAHYLVRVRRILLDVDDAAALARQSQALPHGLVRVLAPSSFATHQLARRLPRFHRAHPQVTVDVTAAGPVESLDEDHDITIVVRQPRLDGDFVARALGRSEVIACATPDYLQRHGRPGHPRELAAHQLLLPAPHKGMTFSHSDGERYTVSPQQALLHSANAELHQAGVLAGIGISGLPSFSIGQALRERRLERVLPAWHLFHVSIWACMPTRRHVPASTRAFMDFLLGEFGAQDTDPWTPSPEASPCH